MDRVTDIAWKSEMGALMRLATLRYRFQGREWSAATGLVHFRNRWFDCETGRWLSKDPIRLSGGLNLYAFCGNDPVNCTDSLGLKKDNKKKSDGKRGGSGGGNGDGGGSTPGDTTLGDIGDNIEGLFDKVGDFWNDHIKDRLDGVNSAVQTGALPTTMGTAAAALDGVAIGGALARGISEWQRSMSLLQSGALEANDLGHELQKCEHTVHRASSGIDSAMNIKK